jgi:hypothetical protein
MEWRNSLTVSRDGVEAVKYLGSIAGNGSTGAVGATAGADT